MKRRLKIASFLDSQEILLVKKLTSNISDFLYEKRVIEIKVDKLAHHRSVHFCKGEE